MNLIVFDLEWNMGNAPKTFNYHGAELTLRGEIIQIGAVRVDENGDVLDTFEMTLRPRIFRKLHWRIAEVTGLSQGDLEAGCLLPKAAAVPGMGRPRRRICRVGSGRCAGAETEPVPL